MKSVSSVAYILMLTASLHQAIAPNLLFADIVSPVTVTTVIDSTVQNVWDVMIDFENYGRWNQWAVKIDGEPKVGAVVKAYSDTGKTLNLQITTLQEPHIFRWKDVTWFTYFGAGGWRCRTIEPNSKGSGVKFTNHFEYTGVFRKVLEYLTRDMLEKGMQMENENLRDFVEKKEWLKIAR